MAAAAVGADGIMVEVHPRPEEAICDGPQSLPTDGLDEYVEQLRATAALAGKTLAAPQLQREAA
jgi:3-deoxy-7-phosphoheptulonate synthase